MALQLATAAANVRRDNHRVLNPMTGLYERALLLEGSRRNHFVNTAAPVGSGLTITLAAAAGIDGTDTAARATKTSASDQYVVQSFAGNNLTASTTYTIYRWVKYDGHDVTVSLEHNSGPDWGGSGWNARFSVTAAGVVFSSQTGCVGRVASEVINGFYRIEAVVTTGATAITTATSVLNRIVGASGATLLVDAPQLEAGAFASSFIPTTGVSVTRAADSFSLPFPWAPQEMTVYTRFIERGSTVTGSGTRVLQIGAAGSNVGNRLWVRTSTANLYYAEFTSGASTATSAPLGAAPAIGDLVEIRVTLTASGDLQFHRAYNSGAEVSGTAPAAVALPAAWAGPTSLYLNSTTNGIGVGFNAFLGDAATGKRPVVVARGIKSLAVMRAMAGVS